MNKIEQAIYQRLQGNVLLNKWENQKDLIKYLAAHNINITERYLRTCIQNIRKDSSMNNIILTDFNKGYKILTEVEHKQYLENRKISLLKSLKQYWKDVNNFNLNNQLVIDIDNDMIKMFDSIPKK